MSARPQPVALANAGGTAIATVIAAVVGFGIVPAATGDALNNALVISIPAIVALSGVVHTLISLLPARAKTTPSADPKGLVVQADGTTALEPLVPVSFTATESFDDEPARHADQGEDDDAPNDGTPEPAAASDELTFDDDPAPAAV